MLLFLSVGLLIGRVNILPKKILTIIPRVTMGALMLLLASMGMRLGSDPKILNNIFILGIKALSIAVATIIGSLLFLRIFLNKIKFESKDDEQLDFSKTNIRQKKVPLTLLLLSSLLFGVLLALKMEFSESSISMVSIITLWIMLFNVGVELGNNRKAWNSLNFYGWKIICIPASIALGSITGAVVMGVFLGYPVNEASAVGAGFGWYSLSGVLLTNIYSLEIGIFSFLSNILRELLAIMFIPMIVRRARSIFCIALGAGTTMGSTMPIIASIAGTEIALIGFVNGFILNASVPLLLPLLIKIPF